jgi:hypothetical protein
MTITLPKLPSYLKPLSTHCFCRYLKRETKQSHGEKDLIISTSCGTRLNEVVTTDGK